jgi:hypothetical protein
VKTQAITRAKAASLDTTASEISLLRCPKVQQSSAGEFLGAGIKSQFFVHRVRQWLSILAERWSYEFN